MGIGIKNKIPELYLEIQSVWKVGKILGISGQSVHQYLSEKNLINKMNYFTKDDSLVLIEKYKKFRDAGNLKELALQMNRTVPFISRKAKELGLTDKTSRVSMKPFADKISENTKKFIKEKGHPKGMLNKKHSEEFKQGASNRSKMMWANPNSVFNSQEHKQSQSDRMSKWQSERESSNNYSRTAIGWFEKDGKLLFMRSSWELNYAHYLNFLIEHKQIISWEYEVDTFWFEKIKRGVRSYKPDFKVTCLDNSIEYHEVKGWMDEKSITKLKRMKLYHPNIKIKVVDEKEYKAIKKKSSIIKNWGVWVAENPNKKTITSA
jgi:hypothetical protein